MAPKRSQARDKWVDGSLLALIPAGSAIVGTSDEATLSSVEGDTPWYDVRRIETSRLVPHIPSFQIGNFPVTCAQFAAFLNEVEADLINGWAQSGDTIFAADVPCWLAERDPREAPHGVGVRFVPEQGWQPCPDCAGLPVTLVTWYGADAYARHYSARLPTEVEWEKAARGAGQGFRFPWGDSYQTGKANLADLWAGCPVDTQADWDSRFSQAGNGPAWLASRPNASGAFPQGVSPYGVEDMIGNVAEWCEDIYDATSEGGRADFRAMRGAGRYGYTAIARCATRRRRAPESASENLGFRIAVDPQPGGVIL